MLTKKLTVTLQSGPRDIEIRELTAGEFRERRRGEIPLDEELLRNGVPPEVVDLMPMSEFRRVVDEIYRLSGLLPVFSEPEPVGNSSRADAGSTISAGANTALPAVNSN